MPAGAGMKARRDLAPVLATSVAGASRPRDAAPFHLRLLQLHRHSLINLLVTGGTANEREQVARSFHAQSPLRSGPFVRLDCAFEEERLCRALMGWISGAFDFSDSSLVFVERGTLFLDNVELLTPRAQRLLFTFVSHYAAPRAWSDGAVWGGRLAAGSCGPLDDLALEGRFYEPLYDCLDKARIELDDLQQGSAA